MKREPKESLEQVAYQHIKNLLANYRVAPGQRLIYQDLANLFHVSRTPIKNALSRLEQEGYVTLIPEKGYIVREITFKEASELLDVLEMLEFYAVEKAIKNNPTMAQLPEITNILEEYSNAVQKELNRERFRIDARLHTKIVELAGNTFLTAKVNEIFEKMYLQIRISGLSQKRGEVAREEHHKIYKALRQRITKDAVKWVIQHARSRKANILSNAFAERRETYYENMVAERDSDSKP